MTSYPNLIARQMKLKKFEQPLFDATDYNGFGRKTRTGFNPTGGPVPKFNEVKNNSGVEDATGTKVKLKQAKNLATIDHYGIPFLNESSVDFDIENFDTDYSGSPLINSSIYAKRVIANDKKATNLTKIINSTKYDILTVDIWSDNFIKNASLGGSSGGTVYYLDGTSYTDKIIEKLIGKQKIKVCLANVPDILSFPYFNGISYEMIIKGVLGQPIYLGGITYKEDTGIMLPTGTIDSLVSSKVHISLKKGTSEQNPLLGRANLLYKVDMESTKKSINSQNNTIKINCERYGFALIDINALYKKILSKTYIEDGILIDPTYPSGNFFSSDGLYPTALGQAVIANEFIRSINSTYKTDIPLINVSEYIIK